MLENFRRIFSGTAAQALALYLLIKLDVVEPTLKSEMEAVGFFLLIVLVEHLMTRKWHLEMLGMGLQAPFSAILAINTPVFNGVNNLIGIVLFYIAILIIILLAQRGVAKS